MLTEPAAKPGLVGRGYHKMDDDGEIENQGKIIADLGDGYFLGQLFSWLTGDPTTQKVYTLEDFRQEGKFWFFDSMADANDWAERHKRL